MLLSFKKNDKGREDVVPSLQKLLSAFTAAKRYRSHCGVVGSQEATKEVKGFPEQNAQSLVLFLVLEWNKMKPEKDRH